MTLNERLDSIIAENPNKYTSQTVGNVKNLIGNEKKYVTYRKYFTSIDDFALYHELHPEWQGLSTYGLEKIPGGKAFFSSLCNWINRATQDKQEKQQLVQTIFPTTRKSYSHLKTIDDWKNYHAQHPEWQGLNGEQMKGVSGYYNALVKWADKTAKTKEEKKKLIQTIFPPQRRDYANFKTIDDWKNYHAQHPKWQGLSIFQLVKMPEGSSFYDSLNYWVNKTTHDKQEKQQLVQAIFPPRKSDYIPLKTIDDWKNYHAQHPEWQGLNSLSSYLVKGARAFYDGFLKWTKTNSENEEHRQNLIHEIYPPQKDLDYDHKGKTILYDSRPERIIGILLEKYGLIRKPQEGLNIHVKTNGSKLNSIDFLIDNLFLEYHPLGIADIRASRTLKQSGQRKKDNITNPDYQGFGFVHIWEIDQLYDNLLKSAKIRKKMYKRHQKLTKKVC